MDAKLKALKVVDLKQILSNAAVHVPAKATKADLIARILASQQALDAYAALYPPDDLLAPPEEVDWNADEQPQPAPSPVTPKPAAAAPKPAPAPPPAQPAPATESTPADLELEKRRLRAARFGIPFVEPAQKKVKPAVPAPDPKKLEDRAARFGTNSNDKKRTAPPADPEELEKRKKRAERFGLPVSS